LLRPAGIPLATRQGITVKTIAKITVIKEIVDITNNTDTYFCLYYLFIEMLVYFYWVGGIQNPGKSYRNKYA
jgi:hypothetical protein